MSDETPSALERLIKDRIRDCGPLSVATFMETGLVPRLPTALLCTGLFLLASPLGVCGLILDSVAQSRVEQKRILFLALAQWTR